MKKINNAYLATAKDGSLEKIMAELPDNSGGYAGFFTNLAPKFIEKALKNLSETEKNIHPAMFIPLAFIFQNPPFQISKDLREVAGGKSLQERMIEDFLSHPQIPFLRLKFSKLFCAFFKPRAHHDSHFVKTRLRIHTRVHAMFSEGGGTRFHKMSTAKNEKRELMFP